MKIMLFILVLLLVPAVVAGETQDASQPPQVTEEQKESSLQLMERLVLALCPYEGGCEITEEPPAYSGQWSSKDGGM